MQPHQQLPQAVPMAALTLDGMKEAALRLNDLMTEETVILREMRYKDLAPLYEEKLKLTVLMEAYQQRMQADPAFVRDADQDVREELLLLTDDLVFNAQENFRHVATGKAINQRVLQAIKDVISEDHRPGTYGADGQASAAGELALSMNLNQKA